MHILKNLSGYCKKKKEGGKTGDWDQGRHGSRTNKSIN